MVKAFEITDTEGAALGLSWNLSKDVGRDGSTTCIEALGLCINAPTLTLSLPDSKRDSYLTAINDFYTTNSNKTSCPRNTLEKLLGRRAFTCKVCRWGYLFIQAILDAIYPGFEIRSRNVTLTPALWHDLAFWRQALGDKYSSWLGINQIMIGTKEVMVQQHDFKVHMYSDASKVFGVGGTMGPDQVHSAAWQRNVTDDHIGLLELEAVYENLLHWKHELKSQTVLVWVDNIQAMSALNKGASRIPTLRPVLLNIALLGLQNSFEVKAKYIKGPDNPADAPSRAIQHPSRIYVFENGRVQHPTGYGRLLR